MQKAVKTMRKRCLSATLVLAMILAILLSTPLMASAAVGETFTVNNIEDVSITYMVLTESDTAGTVEMGTGTYSSAIPTATAGALTIPNEVTYAGKTYAVTSIGRYALYNCSTLTSVAIPDSVTNIGTSAFAYCTALMNVTIPDGVTRIGDTAFSGCTMLTEITIPDKVISIGEAAFSLCTALMNVTIPDSVQNIGDWVFSGCLSLHTFTVSPLNHRYTSDGGVLFNENKTVLIAYPSANGHYLIPNGVTSIGNGAFQHCAALTDVTMGNGVQSIGDNAFYDCRALTSATIPDGVTEIGRWAFYGCRALASVTFDGDAPALIRNNAFTGIPGNAIAYVWPDATGFPMEGESWNGLTVQCRTPAVTSIDTGSITTLVSGYAAVLPVNVEGSRIAGKELTLSILNEEDEIVYTSEAFTLTDNTFSTKLNLGKDIMNLPVGEYKVAATGDGVTSAQCSLIIAPSLPEYWEASVFESRYADKEMLEIRFPEVYYARTFNGDVFVNGTKYDFTVVGHSIFVPDAPVSVGTQVKITGVKYPDLFPSYSFTFTVDITQPNEDI